jgi:hypothetical protein
VHNHNGDDDRDGRGNRRNSDDDIPAGIVQVICLRGREEARLRATTRTARQVFFWGMCLLNVNWDCLLLRRVRKDFQW